MKREVGLEYLSRECACCPSRWKESEGSVLAAKTVRKGWIQLLAGCLLAYDTLTHMVDVRD